MLFLFLPNILCFFIESPSIFPGRVHGICRAFFFRKQTRGRETYGCPNSPVRFSLQLGARIFAEIKWQMHYHKPKSAIRVQLAVSDFEKRMSEVLYISLCVSVLLVLSVCPPCLCLRGLRLCPCPSWLMSCGAGLRKFIGLPAMVRGKTSCGPRCGLRRARNILPCRVLCSGLLQSCHFPKSLEQDCCNPAFPEMSGVGFPEILLFPARKCPVPRESRGKTCRKCPVL